MPTKTDDIMDLDGVGDAKLTVKMEQKIRAIDKEIVAIEKQKERVAGKYETLNADLAVKVATKNDIQHQLNTIHGKKRKKRYVGRPPSHPKKYSKNDDES